MTKHLGINRGGLIFSAAAAAVVVVLAGIMPARAAYVITTEGLRVDGSDIRAKSTGEIILSTPQGTRTFYKGQYVKAVADKPPEIDRAVQLIDAKQYDDAVKLLDDVIMKYRFLDWDNQARAMLPVVYTRKGDNAAAIAAYEKLFAMSPQSKEQGDVVWSYREALLSAKQYGKLEQLLNEVIADGSRADAAKAQIMRGDVRLAQDQLEPAALDYMRTVILFKSEKASQPAALLKAAATLEKLRDPRAKEMYRKLVEDYPTSTEAGSARSKL